MQEEQKRRYHSISEVAEMMGLKTHILRFWESQFPQLRPRKNRAGNRAYTERDIKIALLIKHLLYEEKYTIEGAKQRLKTNHELVEDQLSLPLDTVEQKPVITKSDITEVRKELLRLIEMVEEL